MIVENFIESCTQYKDFQIWEVNDMMDFLSGNQVMEEILKADHKMTVSEFQNRRNEIELSDMELMKSMLDQVGDKHFFIFTLNDPNHLELIHLQNTGVMNYGIDINEIDPEKVYIMIMDKATQYN